MPAVTSGKVLVTGANGFIAPHVVYALLQQGYAVRGTVRAEAKGALVQKTFAEYGDKFELVVVDDISRKGAFDQAVQGIDAVLHILTPNHFDVADPDAFIRPAVDGMHNLLISVLNHGPFIRRIVLTSSTVAIVDPMSGAGAGYDASHPRVYTEEDWNDASMKKVEEKGRDAHVVSMYCASKTEAERAAWAFVEEHTAKIKFDLVALNPPWVLGPNFLPLNKPEQLNQSMSLWWMAVSAGGSEMLGDEYIDVRDLTQAHILALQKEAAGGNRIIVSARPFQFQHWVNAAHALDTRIPAGDPSRADVPNAYSYNASKADKLLGVQYRSLEETAKDVIEQYGKLGWIV